LIFPIELLTVSSNLAIDLIHPAPEKEAASIQPIFNWHGDPLTTDYKLEISKEASFKNTVYSSALLTDTFFQLPITLEPETMYQWRITGRNTTCNINTVTAANRFQTEALICKVFSPPPNELPVTFNVLPFIQSFIRVEDDVIIRDVNILDVRGIYPAPSSGLSFRLRSPEGPILEIVKRQETCTIGNSFDFSVDGESSTNIIPCPNDQGLTIPSTDKLFFFNGQNAKGTWSLNIFDNGGEGQLDNWSVEICFGASAITSIEKVIKEEVYLNVYPNPIQNNVIFKMTGENIQQIIISDVTGRVLYKWQDSLQTEVRIPTSSWGKGMYFYSVLDAKNRLQTGKLVKN